MKGFISVRIGMLLMALVAGPVQAQLSVEQLLVRGRVDEALKVLQAAADLAPAERAWLRGQALAAGGQPAQALTAFDEALAASATPSLALREAMAAQQALLGERDSAATIWREVLDRYAATGPQPAVADSLAAARAAAALGRSDPAMYRTALSLYDRALLHAADGTQVRLEIGDLLLAKYNSAEAVEVFRETLGADEEPHVPTLLGLARAQHFDHSRAAESTVETCLSMWPDYVPALVLRARLHLEMEEYGRAGELIDRALSLNAGSREAQTLAAALALLEYDKPRYEALVERVRTTSPGYAEIYLTLSEIAARNRLYSEAVQLALVGVNVDDAAWRGYVLLGINRMRRGDVEAGRASLEVAFKGDPYNVWARNTLALLDKLEGFSVVRSQHFVLVTEAREAPVIAPRALELAEAAYAYYVERYQHRPSTPIRIEMYADHEDFSVRTAGLVGLDILGVSFGPVVALDSPSAGAFGPTNWGSVLWHELAHSFHLSKSKHRAPRWFSEGLAVHEERAARTGWGGDATPGFMRAFAEGRLPPPSGLNEAFLRPSYPEQIVHGYYLGSVLMDYLEQTYGFAAIDAILAGFAEGASLDELVAAHLGHDLATLDERFDAYLRERFKRELAAVTSDAEDSYPGLLKAARAALESDDLTLAEGLAQRAQAQFPSHAGGGSTYHLLADIYERRGQTRQAIEQLVRSVDIDADDLIGHRRLVKLLLAAGRSEFALSMMERTLYIDPFDMALHTRLAEVHEARQTWQAAAVARAAVVALGASDPVVARHMHARALMESGALREARTELLRALERAPLYEEGLELLLELRERAAAGG